MSVSNIFKTLTSNLLTNTNNLCKTIDKLETHMFHTLTITDAIIYQIVTNDFIILYHLRSRICDKLYQTAIHQLTPPLKGYSK